mgnify:CR=1 FL=1
MKSLVFYLVTSSVNSIQFPLQVYIQLVVGDTCACIHLHSN